MMVLYRGANWQTMVKVALQNMTIEPKVDAITQQVLKIDFGLYALKRMLNTVHMVTKT